MQPIHDVDILLLLAVTMAAKRRPAALDEIVAAADLIQGNVPTEAKLVEAFARLAVAGLIADHDGEVALSANGQAVMSKVSRKGEASEHLPRVKEQLLTYTPGDAQPAILFTTEQLRAALLAHRQSGTGAGKNLLMPKPKPAEDPRRKPLPKRGTAKRRPGPTKPRGKSA